MGFIAQVGKLLNPFSEFVSGKGTLYRQKFTDVAATSNTAVHAAIALTAATQVITTGIVQPVIARNLIVKGNASGNAGNVTVAGTNQFGEAVSETFALNGATAVTGSKVFKRVTSIALPIETHSGTDTVSIGIGVKLGLDRRIAEASAIYATVDTAPDSALPTMGVTYATTQFATAPDGSKDFVIGYVHIDLSGA